MAVTISLATSRTSGIVPLGVYFDATGTTSDQTTRPFHELHFSWNFGDSGSGNHPTITGMPASSRNTATGPLAAHIYETAGSYTVTLDISDGVSVARTTVAITASDWNEGVTGTTLVVAQDGVFTGSPSHAATSTSADFDAVINANVATHKRILFKRGETSTSNNPAAVTVTGPGIFGSWGTGAAHKIENSAAGIIFQFGSAATGATNPEDWRVMDFEVDGNLSQVDNGVDMQGEYDRVTFLRLNIHDIHIPFRFGPSVIQYWNDNGDPGHTLWDEMFIHDCVVARPLGLPSPAGPGSGNGCFIGAQRFSMQGNSFSDSTGGEHVIRFPYLYKFIISNNTLFEALEAKHVIKLHGNKFVVCPSQFTELGILADNRFFGSSVGKDVAWTVAIGPQDDITDDDLRNIIVERNWWAPGTTQQQVCCITWADDVTIRNNIFDTTNCQDSVAVYVAQRGIEGIHNNVRCYNNTSYTSSVISFIPFQFASGTGHECRNNLGYGPSSSAGRTMVSGTGYTASNNTTSTNILIEPKFATSTGTGGGTLTVPTDFKLRAGQSSHAEAAGLTIDVLEDFFDAWRFGATYDVGFHQLNAGSNPFPAVGGGVTSILMAQICL